MACAHSIGAVRGLQLVTESLAQAADAVAESAKTAQQAAEVSQMIQASALPFSASSGGISHLAFDAANLMLQAMHFAWKPHTSLTM